MPVHESGGSGLRCPPSLPPRALAGDDQVVYSFPTARRRGREDDRDRRRLRRPDRRERPRRLQQPVRAAGLHDGQRLLQEGQPDRRHELPAQGRRLGARDLARRPVGARDRARARRSCSSRRAATASPTCSPPRTTPRRTPSTSRTAGAAASSAASRRYDCHFVAAGRELLRLLRRRRPAGRVPVVVAERDLGRRHDAALQRRRPSPARPAGASGGGGCSAYETATAAQSGFTQYGQVNCAGKRATPDVSLDADPGLGRLRLRLHPLPGPGRLVQRRRHERLVADVGGSLRGRRARRRTPPTSTAPTSPTATSPPATTARRAWSASTSCTGRGSWIGWRIDSRGRLRQPLAPSSLPRRDSRS